ncbi:unnamed protein product, partial [Phaeothamnion confervicola]
LNEGNGHPFSYSAIFNGYDPEALATRCPYTLIREYLPRDHRNQAGPMGAKVTHIWTQDPKLSLDVAAVARIPTIVDRIGDMLGKVDAVILARDDPWNHLEHARPAFAAGLPIFIDKQLAATPADFAEILRLAPEGYPLLAGSAARFTRDTIGAAATLADFRLRAIHGVSRVSWLRYGHHLLEPIVALRGTDVEWVRSLWDGPDHDAVQIAYRDGVTATLEFFPDLHLPIESRFHFADRKPFALSFEDFFGGFRNMLAAYVEFLRTGRRPFPRAEMLAIARIVLAGELSKKRGGDPVS